MDFSLNEEQLAIRDTCREFAEQEIKPLAEDMDRTGAFPYPLIRNMAALGLLGLPFPEEYGGAGADFLSYCLAIEEISRGDVSNPNGPPQTFSHGSRIVNSKPNQSF